MSQHGWLRVVARNIAATRSRREHAAQVAFKRVAGPEAFQTDVEFDRAELRCIVQEAAVSLPDIYRDVIVRHFFDGQPIGEIASEFGLPVETIRSRRKRALALLRCDRRLASLA